MVDHVEFESAAIIENFLRFWRQSGQQRFGFLYGRYEVYDKVPLGIKAIVSAIYEPPQESLPDGVELSMHEPDEDLVDRIASFLGLRRVGMIFTDLVDDGTGKGKVVCRRSGNSYFMSSSEIYYAAKLQLRYPSPCRHSSSGRFGSKFVSVVASGNRDGSVDLFAYQVTVQAMSMVQASIVEPSTDPTRMLVKASSATQYVPEVFFKYKNEYNVDVVHSAKPAFPVDFLLVALTHGFPVNPVPLFVATEPFPIENRGALEPQSIVKLASRLRGSNVNFATALSDFHLLLFIAQSGLFDLSVCAFPMALFVD